MPEKQNIITVEMMSLKETILEAAKKHSGAWTVKIRERVNKPDLEKYGLLFSTPPLPIKK